MNYLLGTSLFILSTVLLIKTAGEVYMMWDWKTFAFVAAGSLSLLIANKSKNDILGFGDDVRSYLADALERVGAIGAIIGFIQMLHNFSDPKLIGPPMAVCVLSILYSEILVLLIGKKSFENRSHKGFSRSFFALFASFIILVSCFR